MQGTRASFKIEDFNKDYHPLESFTMPLCSFTLCACPLQEGAAGASRLRILLFSYAYLSSAYSSLKSSIWCPLRARRRTSSHPLFLCLTENSSP